MEYFDSEKRSPITAFSYKLLKIKIFGQNQGGLDFSGQNIHDSFQKTCGSRIMNTNDFIRFIGFDNPGSHWSLYISWGTIHPKNWVLARNKLKQEDHKLTLTLNDRHWDITFDRHDDLFTVQWRDSGVTVESQQLRYRHVLKWPQIESVIDTPSLIEKLEDLLEIKFVRQAFLDGSLSTTAVMDGFNSQPLTDWLGSSADGFSSWGSDD